MWVVDRWVVYHQRPQSQMEIYQFNKITLLSRCATSPIMELSELKDDIVIITTNSSSEDVPLIGEEVANLRRELSTTTNSVYALNFISQF